MRKAGVFTFTFFSSSWRIFCGFAAKNRAIRSKSSALPSQSLRAFRFYPLRAQGPCEAVKGSHKIAKQFFQTPALAAALAFFCLFVSCQTKNDDFAEAPIITSATLQHTLYNGRPQPITVETAKPGALYSVTYFSGQDAIERNEGGFCEAPARVGVYYASIKRPAGNGYAAGRPVSVEYHIQKAFVTILAEEKQEARYDGLPKTITAAAQPPVPLLVSYYSLPRSANDAPARDAPAKPGVYRVTISFDGDENYRPVSKDVEFGIR
jgi:hypothetical protein